MDGKLCKYGRLIYFFYRIIVKNNLRFWDNQQILLSITLEMTFMFQCIQILSATNLSDNSLDWTKHPVIIRKYSEQIEVGCGQRHTSR